METTLILLDQSTKTEVSIPSSVFEEAYQFAVKRSENAPETEFIFRKKICTSLGSQVEDWRLKAGRVLSHIRFPIQSVSGQFGKVVLNTPQHPI